MAELSTAHWKEDGEQVTERRVTVNGTDHAFRVTDDGEHEYQGDGDPPTAALDALEAAGHIEQESTEGQTDE